MLEETLYILVFASMIGALVYRFTFGLRKAAGQTRKTQLVMFTLLGSGMLIMGMLQTFDIAFSKSIIAEGWITRLYTTSGKGSHSSFTLISDDGSGVWLSDDYIGPRLINGERVRVTYRSRTSDVTALQVLSGRNAGWKDTEYPGIFGAFIGLIIGAGLLCAGWFTWRSKSAI